MPNGKVMTVHLIAGLIKKLNQIIIILSIAVPLYENEPIFSKTV